MLKRSGQVALCGMIAAVCILLMLMTGLFPFATYALPAVAGLLMVAVVVECGVKWAVMVYVAVSLLAIFITPDREAMLMFVFFFGHYPIIKGGPGAHTPPAAGMAGEVRRLQRLCTGRPTP